MDLRHLRYFVAVAEERHFTRAAQRLGIQQPPLSQQIRQLEDEMGTKLLRRLTRGVELTESGAFLLEEAYRILAHVERAKADVQSLARGTTGRIRMGFGGATSFAPLVSQIILAFRERYPQVTLIPEQSVTPRLVKKLKGNEVDVAFLRPPIEGGDGLGLDVMIEERMIAILPVTHRLADRASVQLAELADETFILYPRADGPGLYDEIVACCQRVGFAMKLGQATPDIPAIVLMVGAGFGISIIPQSLSQVRVDGVAYIPIEGEQPKAAISLGYRRDGQSQAVRNFVAVAKRMRLVN